MPVPDDEKHAISGSRPASSNGTAIRCRDVWKSYGRGETKVAALRGIDLNVSVGEILMVVGPSGCGKTTLVSVIAAILRHDSGECQVLGRDLQRMDDVARAQFRRKSVGFVFQMFNLLPALSAVENVAVPLLIDAVPWDEAAERARQMIDAVGLGRRSDTLPDKLSGGEQQRVAIARALVHNPALVLCDEPTSNLDHETGRAVMEILAAVAKKPDRTIIVVTHDPRIFSFADRAARMDDGCIVEISENNDRG